MAFYEGLFESAASLLEEHPEAKVLIDLRDNGGGWFSPVQYIRLRAEILTRSRVPELYVATNGLTASAATNTLLFFKESMNAIQIGEPTGQFSLYFCGDMGGRILPNSKIPFRVSPNWEDVNESIAPPALYDENGKLYDWENTILPDVYVSQDIEDVKAGRDSVIEWVLGH